MNKHILLRIALLFLVISTFTLQAQKGYTWKKLGNKGDTSYFDPDPAYHRLGFDKCINGEYYTVIGRGPNHIISKWNGTSWNSYPPLNLKGGSISDLQVFNNELYVSGANYGNLPIAQRNNGQPFPMIKFNGVSWDSIPTRPEKDSSHTGNIDNMTVCNGNMYYLAHTHIAAGSVTKIYKMTSSGVHTMIQSYRIKGGFYEEGSLCAMGDTLVVGSGEFDTLEYGKPTSGIAFYDGSTFSYLNSPQFSGVMNLASNGSNISNPGLFTLNSSMVAFVSPDYDLILIKNSKFYRKINVPDVNYPSYSIISVTLRDNMVIPNFLYTACPYYYDLSTDQWVKGRAERVMVNNMSSGRIFGFPFNFAWPPRMSHLVELVKGSEVSGKVYADADSSCSFDTMDMALKHILLEFDNGTNKYYTYTEDDGKYETCLLPGNYSVKYYLSGTLSSISPCSPVSLNILTDSMSFDSIDFPVHLSTNRNLGVSIDAARGFRTRQGFTENYVLKGTNYGFRKDSVILKLWYPAKATLVSSSITPFSNAGNELVYKFGNLEWRDERSVNLKFTTSTGTSTLGDEITFYASVLNSAGDSLMENNEDSLRQKIVAAYDPNIKQSFPQGKVSPGLKKIKYVIHFQNTGRDTANKVTVIDTFVQKLGLRSLRMTSTSHPSCYNLRVDNKQTLIWEFSNIMLPDSHVNEKASHGYIAFEADINGYIAAGDSITNKAYIYFDYQEPVKTNTASVVIFKPDVEIQPMSFPNGYISLYPNPANSTVNININPLYNQGKILLYNSLGQLVVDKKISDGTTTFQVSHLSKGIYLVKVEGTDISAKLLVE